jgi:hypothetical protein
VLASIVSLGFTLSSFAAIIGAHPSSIRVASHIVPQTTPTLAISDASLAEGDSGTSSIDFTVTLTAAGARPAVSCRYATADGPMPSGATAPSDYAAASGAVRFPAGSGNATMTISITINGDTDIEGDEIFFVNLSNADGGTIIDGQGIGTIRNDDSAGLPTLSISDAGVFEGDSSNIPTNAVFTVSLSAASSSTVTVDYATADGSATVADDDYVSRSGTLTFAPGDTSKTISVQVIGDTKTEETEVFSVNLSDASGATIVDGHGDCLIFSEERCSYSLNPASQFFPQAGGTGSFDVHTSPACQWIASVAVPWITITSGGRGIGDGTVGFSVAPNSPVGDRTGHISINNTFPFFVFQNDSDSCFISVDPLTTSCAEACGSNITVTAPDGCSWTAISNTPWITVTSGASGVGSGKVGFLLSRNSFVGSTPGPARAGTMTIAGQLATFTQEGCSLSLESESQEFQYYGGSGVVDVFTPCDGWTVTSDSPWITISEVNTSDRGFVKYTVPLNTGGRRTGTITIGNKTLTIVQNEKGNQCTVSLSPATGTASPQGGTGSFSINLNSGCPWSVVSTVPWISIGSVSGAGSASIQYTVQRNGTSEEGKPEVPGPPRQGSIIVNGEVHHDVYQDSADCPLKLICSFFPGVCLPDDDGQNVLAEARGFRDKALARTERGRAYTQLYYKFSTEAVGVLMLHPSLILRSRDIMDRYKPALDSMIKGEPVTLTQGDIKEIDDFLNAFAEKGSAELKQAIKGLSEDLRNPGVQKEFNITVTNGPRRESSSSGISHDLNHSGMLFGPVGLAFLSIFAIWIRRKKPAPFRYKIKRRPCTLSGVRCS